MNHTFSYFPWIKQQRMNVTPMRYTYFTAKHVHAHLYFWLRHSCVTNVQQTSSPNANTYFREIRLRFAGYVYSRFQDKIVPNALSFGAEQKYIAYMGEYPRYRAWGTFLESPGNFTGPKWNIQIEI